MYVVGIVRYMCPALKPYNTYRIPTIHNTREKSLKPSTQCEVRGVGGSWYHILASTHLAHLIICTCLYMGVGKPKILGLPSSTIVAKSEIMWCVLSSALSPISDM